MYLKISTPQTTKIRWTLWPYRSFMTLYSNELDFAKTWFFQDLILTKYWISDFFIRMRHSDQWIYLNLFPAQVLIKCFFTFCKNLFRQHIARYQKHNHHPEELAGWFCCCHFQTPILLWRVGWIKILWKVIWNGPKKM